MSGSDVQGSGFRVPGSGFCDKVLDVIEPIAAGDLTPDAHIEAHLATCARCRAALENARAIEHLLQSRPAPAAPPQFTPRALARIRRDQWRRDQLVDAGFNTAVIGLIVAILAGMWLLVDQTGIITLNREVIALVELVVMTLVERIAPAVPLYATATALLAAIFAVWWWAERDTVNW